MRITLKNFRTHNDRIFEIPDKGLILLNGSSGSGKSTILNAIYYALYGKLKKPYSYNSKTCSVCLENDHILIERNSNPNRIIVNYESKEYIDESAQAVIDNYMKLNHNEFKLSSYFDQKKHSSIMSMSPSEQMSFVEELAFSNDEHVEIKEKIKEHIKLLEKEKIKCETVSNVLTAQIEKKEENMSKYKIHIPEDFDPETIEREYKKCDQDIEKFSGKIQKIKDEIKEKEIENKKLLQSKKKYEKVMNEIDHIKNQRKDLELVDEKVIREKESILEGKRELLEDWKQFNKARELEKIINDLSPNGKCKIDLKDCKQKMSNYKKFAQERDFLNQKLVTIADDREVFEKSLQKFKKKLRNFINGKITKECVEEKLQSLEKEIQSKELLNQKIYKCPKCESNLGILDSKLFIIEKTTLNDEENFELVCQKKNCEKLREYSQNYFNAFEELDKNTKLLDKTQKRVDEFSDVISLEEFETLKDLTNDKNNKLIKKYQKEKDILEKDINSDLFKNYKSIDALEIEIRDLEKAVNQMWVSRSEENKLRRELNIREKLISDVDQRDFQECDDSIEKLRDKLNRYEDIFANKIKDLSQLQSDMRTIQSVKTRKNEEKELAVLNSELSTANSDLKIKEKDIQSSLILQKTAQEAEFVSIVKTINSINEHAKIYLDSMFEDKIIARISIKKHTKKGDLAAKPKLYVKILYKGHEYDSIEDLSGGERQRCDLSFLLGVNDMLGSKIILLDECMNNLDQNINTDVIRTIRDLCSSKQIIIASHEAITGIFDTIIKL